MAALPLVSIIIANWNGQAHLARCLPSLLAQTYPALEIIVVDNGSTDESVAWLRTHYPQVQCVVNAANLGFAMANNQGARVAHGDYLVLLNNDTWVEPDWLAALVAALEARPQVGMVASLMVFAAQPTIVNSTGVCIDQLGVVWDRLGGAPVASVAPEVVEIFGPCAGAALYRRTLWDEVGGFDEDFFAYLEDVDLAWRARWRGWGAVFAPKAKVYHAHSATGGEGSAFKTYWLARNKVRLLLKNYPWPQLAGWGVGIVLYDFLSLLNAAARGQGLSAWTGRWASWQRVAQLWRQRPNSPTVSAATLFRWLEPWAWPWQVARRYAHHVQLNVPANEINHSDSLPQ